MLDPKQSGSNIKQPTVGAREWMAESLLVSRGTGFMMAELTDVYCHSLLYNGMKRWLCYNIEL